MIFPYVIVLAYLLPATIIMEVNGSGGASKYNIRDKCNCRMLPVFFRIRGRGFTDVYNNIIIIYSVELHGNAVQ